MTEAGGGDGASRHVGPIAYMARNGVAANLLMVGILAAGLLSLGTIEVPAARLRALGLTLSDVAAAVRSGTLELSAGSIEPRDGRVRIRTAGRSYNQHDFENIIVLARNDGTTVRLADIAEVRDGFAEGGLVSRYSARDSGSAEGQSPDTLSRLPEARAALDEQATVGADSRMIFSENPRA